MKNPLVLNYICQHVPFKHCVIIDNLGLSFRGTWTL